MIIKKGKPPLSKEKLISYVKRYQQGEKDVFHEIIEHNYGFLIDMIKESCPIGVKGSGHADWDDLLSEAVIVTLFLFGVAVDASTILFISFLIFLSLYLIYFSIYKYLCIWFNINYFQNLFGHLNLLLNYTFS